MARKKHIWVTRKGKAATVLDALGGNATRLGKSAKRLPNEKPSRKKKK